MTILAPLSIGDLADRITILRIKQQRITDPFKLSYISDELAQLQSAWDAQVERPVSGELDMLVGQLQEINTHLWVLEDEARSYDLTSEPTRVADCLFAITRANDQRARLKHYINNLMGSSIVEMKSHKTNTRNTEGRGR